MLRGLAVSLLLSINLAFWGALVFLGGILRLLVFGDLRRRVIGGVVWLAECWVGVTDRIIDAFLDTVWDIEGLEGLRRDGHYLVICNHISWVDIVALNRAFHGRAPLLRFFLKRALFWAPAVGQAAWALDFPFMRRYTPEYLERHPEKRGRDLETTRRACERFKTIPVTILNFLEGTRFSRDKQEDQGSPYRYLLRPRIGGISFVLAAMAGRLDGVIDVTLAYPEHETTMVEFVTNRLERVTLRARRIEIPKEFTSDGITEPGPDRDRLREWVEQIWADKDALIASLTESSSARGSSDSR